MAKKNFYNKLMKLETEVVNAVLNELVRVGRDFCSEDSDVMEFWEFSTPSEQNISKICCDGIIVCENGEEYSITKIVNDGIIPLCDAISIYESLIALQSKK